MLARQGAKRGHSLLDAGCWTGLFFRDWRARFGGGPDVGIDYAWPAPPLALRQANAARAGASASELPFADGAFDAVHSVDLLQHMTVAGAGAALTGFQRVPRPEGLVALRLRAMRQFAVKFLRRVNVLPSPAAELAQRLRPAARDDSAPVKGLALRAADDWRDRALGAALPVGHTILPIGRKR